MSSYSQSQRVTSSTATLTDVLRDLDIRLSAREQHRVGPHNPVAIAAVGTLADRPTNPQNGDKVLVIDSNTVYTANATGSWVQGGSIP